MSARGIAAARFGLTSQFLDGLAPPELEIILASARQRHFLARSVVVNQGDPADRLFLLTSGRARYFYMADDGQKVLLLWLTPGDIFGGGALLRTPSSYLVSAETVKDSSVLVWDRATLRGLVARYPKVLDNALLCAADYLTWYVAAHLALANRKAHERLARVLLYLAETIGQKVPSGLEFDATNEEIASAANVTPFTASRLLRKWQNDHALIKRRGKIILRSPKRLFLHTA